MKSCLKSKICFHQIDRYIKNCVQSCIPCQTSMPQHKNMNPCNQIYYQKTHAKAWYGFQRFCSTIILFLLLIDKCSRFPEVEVLSTTEASEVISKLNQIFGTRGVPEQIRYNNRPTFNGMEFKEYARKRRFYYQLVTPEQPNFNGLSEILMCMLPKVAYAACLEHKDPISITFSIQSHCTHCHWMFSCGSSGL